MNGTKLSADFNFDYYGEFYMKIDNKKARIILAVIIAVSLVISTVYMFAKQGFHEDELLTLSVSILPITKRRISKTFRRSQAALSAISVTQ